MENIASARAQYSAIRRRQTVLFELPCGGAGRRVNPPPLSSLCRRDGPVSQSQLTDGNARSGTFRTWSLSSRVRACPRKLVCLTVLHRVRVASRVNWRKTREDAEDVESGDRRIFFVDCERVKGRAGRTKTTSTTGHGWNCHGQRNTGEWRSLFLFGTEEI